MLNITRTNVFPKGGWKYIQPETGMKFGGNERFRQQAALILAHRKGNNLKRATLDEVERDLTDYTCARLPGICVEDGKTIVFSVRTNTVSLTSKTDAVPVKRKKCGTCGGRKAKL